VSCGVQVRHQQHPIPTSNNDIAHDTLPKHARIFTPYLHGVKVWESSQKRQKTNQRCKQSYDRAERKVLDYKRKQAFINIDYLSLCDLFGSDFAANSGSSNLDVSDWSGCNGLKHLSFQDHWKLSITHLSLV
jgi:hypothetical protein